MRALAKHLPITHVLFEIGAELQQEILIFVSELKKAGIALNIFRNTL